MRAPGQFALVALSSLVLAACGGDEASVSPGADKGAAAKPAAAAPAEGESAVTVKVFQFEPSPVTVKAGTTVRWTNEDVTLHDVTAGTRDKPGKAFGGDLDKSGGTYEFTFAEPGTYDYFCSLHSGPGMTSKVIVD
jgi:plastocyanin